MHRNASSYTEIQTPALQLGEKQATWQQLRENLALA